MNIINNLDKASGAFFFSGFLLSKLQYIPILSVLFRLISLNFYAIAYSLWLSANLLRPDEEKIKDKWYGFAQIKDQFFISSILGLIATTLSITSVFIPPLFPPAAWIFLFGNTLWTIGELHKLNNPSPNDPNFSYTRQNDYYKYAVTTTVISAITAISATVIFIFPPITMIVTISSLLVCVGIGVFSCEFWLSSNFGKHKPTPIPESYNQMKDILGASVSIELSDVLEPSYSSYLFEPKEPRANKIIDSVIENENEYGLGAAPSL